MPKDKVVFRSDVSSADKTPFMKAPRKVRDYFSQYGPCEVDWSTHSSRGGMEKYAVVLKFEQPAIANKIKQKYNGRALFGARITTSWLDDRQARELGIPPSQPERPVRRLSPDSRGRGRRGRSLSRARGRNSPLFPLPAQEKVTRSGADPELTDSSSESSLPFNYEKRNRSPSPVATTKIHSMTRLERSSRLSPVSTPRASPPIKERSDVLERPESRTSSHSSKERERERELLQSDRNQTSSPRHSTRLRSKRRLNSDDDKSPPRSKESKPSKGKKDSSSRIYVPRSKRVKDESEEGNTSDEKKRTIFDRLGPTLEQREKQYQLEAYGDTNGTTTPPTTVLKGRKSSETFVSPDRGGLKSPTFENTSRHSSISSGSERETKVPPLPPQPISPHSETESKSRRDSKHGSSRKERSSRRESKSSSKDGSRKNSSSRRERDRDNATRNIVKDAQAVSQPYEQPSHHPHPEIATEHTTHQSPRHQPIDPDIPITAVSVTATAEMPTTTTAKVPVTATAIVPITTTADVPITTTAEVPITTAKMPVTTTAEVAIISTAKMPITTTAKAPITTTAEMPIATAKVPIATTAKVCITTTEVTITKEPANATATELKPLSATTPHVPEEDHPVEPPVAFDEKDETPPPEVLEASGDMYSGYAAQWYQAMYNDPYALQQYMQSYYQQQQQHQMLKMGAEHQQPRTDQQQLQPEWQLQHMKTEKRELGPIRQKGPVRELGPLMQPQIPLQQKICVEQQPAQQQVWRQTWPEQQQTQAVKQIQPLQQQVWPLHPGPIQQQVQLEKQQQVIQPLQQQMRPLQQQTWPIQQPVHQIGSLQQQTRPQQQKQQIQPVKWMQPSQQPVWPLQQQLEPVRRIGSLQQTRPVQPKFLPLQQHVWPPKQQLQPVHQIGSLQQQVKTEHTEPEQEASWGSIPDEVGGYRMQQSDNDDSESGEQADEDDAFSMEQMYQALQSTTNSKQTEEGAANATLLDERTETPLAQTSQTSQTSSVEEDNVPRLTTPVAKSVISDIGVQCAITPSHPAVPSIPTKATTGTQTGPSVSTGDTKEGEVEEIWNSATGSLRRPKRKRRMGAKYKSLQKSTMEDFAQQAEPILIMTKLLVSQNPSNRAVLLRSMEASLWQVVHTLGSKFAEKTGEDS